MCAEQECVRVSRDRVGVSTECFHFNFANQFCVETQTSSGASEDTRVTMNIASSGRAVADMVRHNELVVVEMEDFVRDFLVSIKSDSGSSSPRSWDAPTPDSRPKKCFRTATRATSKSS